MKLATTMLVFCVGALLALGMVMLYSAGMTKAEHGAQFFTKQLIWACVGLVFCLSAAMLDYRHLRDNAWGLFAISTIMLALVLVPFIGSKIGGARRWFQFGGVSFQPSELAKLVLIVAIAWYGERFQRHMSSFRRGILIPGAFIGLTLGLIFLEPDVGTTLLLAGVSAVMLLTAGIRWSHFLPPVIAVLVALGIFLYKDPMRSSRIYSWLHLEETKMDKGLQAWQAKVAFGAGGWQGLGLGNGRQKFGFVPEHHTDFIFSIIGEELGLIATLGVVAAFVGVILSGIYIASRARDFFGLLLASGITFMIGAQAFINIGVVTGALPNKGLPLPFISYGGSNLLLMMTCVGVLLSIARHSSEQTDELTEGIREADALAPQMS